MVSSNADDVGMAQNANTHSIANNDNNNAVIVMRAVQQALKIQEIGGTQLW